MQKFKMVKLSLCWFLPKSSLGILPNIKMNNFNQFFNCRYLQNIMRLLFRQLVGAAMTAL